MKTSQRNLVLFGPPGVGKGTQAAILAEHYGLPHLSTGEILRDEIARGTDLGTSVAEAVRQGGFADDDDILEIISRRIDRADLANGFIMDGFPRNVGQAKRFDELLAARSRKVHAALFLAAPDATVLARLAGRAAGRADDKPETHRERLRAYHEKTKPLVDYYRARNVLAEVNGDQTIEAVAAEARRTVDASTGRAR